MRRYVQAVFTFAAFLWGRAEAEASGRGAAGVGPVSALTTEPTPGTREWWEVRDTHISRSWPDMGTPLEDACPCPQEPCGHVAWSRIDPECDQHGLSAARTMRSMHAAADCPGAPS